MSEFAQTIVAATDFSEASELAIRAAALLAEQNDAALFVVHVHVPPDTSALRVDPATGSWMADDETRSDLHGQLDRLVKRVIPAARRLTTSVATSRRPADGLCHYAEHAKADLLVVATHGRTGVGRFLIGSVAEEVVRKAGCPVLTLRSRLRT
jgi:nucleotide-binding universal stress UspA family protein